MATETSSIDDLLSQSAAPPPMQTYVEPEVEIEENDAPETGNEDKDYAGDINEEPEQKEEETENEGERSAKSYDEYGNEKPAPRTFTEDEVKERINKAMRERLARGNHQASQSAINEQAQQQLTQKANDFEYNPDAEGNWQQQLEQFVEQTFNKIGQRQVAQQQAAKEQQAESEFMDKFTQGMERFNDFRDVVGTQPVTDAMTLALRGVSDPAAFIYAASKRHPTDLQRISQIKDPYSQIVEMGKLEERMKKQPQLTNAPRPIARHSDNAPTQTKKKSTEPTIEDLIANSDKKRLSMIKQKRGR